MKDVVDSHERSLSPSPSPEGEGGVVSRLRDFHDNTARTRGCGSRPWVKRVSTPVMLTPPFLTLITFDGSVVNMHRAADIRRRAMRP